MFQFIANFIPLHLPSVFSLVARAEHFAHFASVLHLKLEVLSLRVNLVGRMESEIIAEMPARDFKLAEALAGEKKSLSRIPAQLNCIQKPSSVCKSLFVCHGDVYIYIDGMMYDIDRCFHLT